MEPRLHEELTPSDLNLMQRGQDQDQMAHTFGTFAPVEDRLELAQTQCVHRVSAS